MIRYTLWKLARRARPDAAFVARLASRFTPRKLANFALRLGASTTALILSLGFGTSAYAYTSDDVTPDHPLYAVRTAMENIEVAAAVTPDMKAAVQRKMVTRRLHEIRVIEARRSAKSDGDDDGDDTGKVLQHVESVLEDGLNKLRPLQRLRLERLKTRLETHDSEHD